MFDSVFRGERVGILVHFSSGVPNPGAPEVPRFAPGETVSGFVQITSGENIPYKTLSVRVKWRTEGKGDTDSVVWYTIEEPAGTLIAGATKTMAFAATLPGEPWSFAGRYINLVWGIEVSVDEGKPLSQDLFEIVTNLSKLQARSLEHFAPFVLAPALPGANTHR